MMVYFSFQLSFLRRQLMLTYDLSKQRTLAASLEQIERLGPTPGSQQESIGVIMFVLKVPLQYDINPC